MKPRPRRSTRLLEVLLLLAFLGAAAFVAAHLPTLQRAGGLLRDSLASGGLLGELLGYLQTALRDLKDVLLSPELVGLYVLITGGIILLENKNPDRTVAWLLVLVLLPLVGLLLYFLVGPRFAAMPWFRRRTPPAASPLTELAEACGPLTDQRYLDALARNQRVRMPSRACRSPSSSAASSRCSFARCAGSSR